MAYPPLEFVNENGEPEGFNVDVFKAVMREMGTDYEIRLAEWNEALDSVKRGDADVFIDFGYSESRAAEYEFGQPHNFISTYMVSRRNEPFKTLDDLRGREIILQRDEITDNKVRSLNITDRYIFVADAFEAFKLLKQNKGDVFVCNQAIAMYYMGRIGEGKLVANQLKIMPPVVTCFAADNSGRHGGLLAEMDAAERRIRKNGIYERIYKKWFAAEDEGLAWGTLLWIASSAAAAAAAVFALWAYWNSRMREREKLMILNCINIPALLMDAKGRFLSANEAFSTLCGKTIRRKRICTDYINCPMGCKTPLEGRCLINAIKAERKSVMCEINIRGRTHQITATPVFDKKGALLYMVESIVDVDDLKRVAASERLFNDFVVSLMESYDYEKITNSLLKRLIDYFKADHCYIFKYSSSSREVEMVGYEKSPGAGDLRACFGGGKLDIPKGEAWFEMLKRERLLFFPDMTLDEPRRIFGMWSPPAERLGVKSLYVFGIFSGSELTGSCGIAFSEGHRILDDNDKRILRNISSMINVVRQKQAESVRLVNALNDAREAEKAKSYFFASMSHEIRTPLNSVIGFSNLIKDRRLDPDTLAEYADNISFAGNALLDMISDVLDISKFESGKFEIMPAPTDMGPIFSGMAGVLRDNLRDRDVSPEIDVGPIPALCVDGRRIKQVLFNLISNALKFTQKGSVSFRARFEKTDAGRGTLEFSVGDTGIGIGADDRERIFEPFIQGKAMRGTYAQNRGTGLGLAICRKIVCAMGGRIDMESEPGKGSVFTVSIPGLRCENLALPSKAAQTGDFWRDRRVLIVDDVKMNLLVLDALMKKLGAKTFTTDDPAIAFEVFSRESFDSVFTDMWMPEISGAELAAKMKSVKPDVPIFAVSADTAMASNFDMGHIDGVATKPVTREQLTALGANIAEGDQPAVS